MGTLSLFDDLDGVPSSLQQTQPQAADTQGTEEQEDGPP